MLLLLWFMLGAECWLLLSASTFNDAHEQQHLGGGEMVSLPKWSRLLLYLARLPTTRRSNKRCGVHSSRRSSRRRSRRCDACTPEPV